MCSEFFSSPFLMKCRKCHFLWLHQALHILDFVVCKNGTYVYAHKLFDTLLTTLTHVYCPTRLRSLFKLLWSIRESHKHTEYVFNQNTAQQHVKRIQTTPHDDDDMVNMHRIQLASFLGGGSIVNVLRNLNPHPSSQIVERIGITYILKSCSFVGSKRTKRR